MERERDEQKTTKRLRIKLIQVSYGVVYTVEKNPDSIFETEKSMLVMQRQYIFQEIHFRIFWSHDIFNKC